MPDNIAQNKLITVKNSKLRYILKFIHVQWDHAYFVFIVFSLVSVVCNHVCSKELSCPQAMLTWAIQTKHLSEISIMIITNKRKFISIQY